MNSSAQILSILRRPAYTASVILLAGIVLLAIFGTLIAPSDPHMIDVTRRLSAPNFANPFGTDQFGRDLLSRMLSGCATSLKVSALVVIFAMTVGTALGATAGYLGGFIDRIVTTISEALLALPGILLALALVAVVGASESGVVIALGIAFTPNVARVSRGLARSLRELAFIQISYGLGHSHVHIIYHHIFRNMVGPLTVLGTSYFALALLSESALSFLGLGVPPPSPSWGGLLAEGSTVFSNAPWMVIFPGLAITLTLLCVNLLGDALRDAFDPHSAIELHKTG